MRTPAAATVVAVTVLISAAVAVTVRAGAGQASTSGANARTPDGKPNLNGVWQTINTANWDLQAHNSKPSPIPGVLGAAFAVPPGMGVVEGEEIPYQPWALAKKKENAVNWLKLDPEVSCYLPGVPRATYIGHPLQILQTPRNVLIVYEYANANRFIPIGLRKEEPPIDSWMGESVARWDGDTLVVDGKGFNDRTWFDRAGNFHSEALHVVERYTLLNEHVLSYEATMEDPKVFTRPWKISMPLYRRAERDAQLMEFRCVDFAEEYLYGDLVKPGHPKSDRELPPR